MKEFKPTAPIIFVTGIGQTWSTLGNRFPVRWNLFPRTKELLLDGFSPKNYLDAGLLALGGAASVLTGAQLSGRLARNVVSSLMKYCIPDENGNIPEEVTVRVYGPRSFDVLGKTDFDSGLIDENSTDTLLDRLYRDIPCKRLSYIYGEENLYCFNYCSFSKLYSDADALQKMIEAVIEDQKTKTGSDKVILVPMSMGATVVNAYLDSYGSSLVSKVISIVGAWNGSDALADLLVFRSAPDASLRLDRLLGGKALETVQKLKKEKLHNTLAVLTDALVEEVLLKTTTFMALIPSERYDEVSKVLFTQERFRRNPFLYRIKEEAERYHSAQSRLKERLYALKEKYGTEFYFISGYDMDFGDGSNDFSFLSLMASNGNANTDGVIQISSTAPGTIAAPAGQKVKVTENSVISPDGSIDASGCYFRDTAWYFDGQKHELGTNNTALRLAFDIALGKTKDVNGKYPQFNKSRDISGVYELLEKAKAALEKDGISENEYNEFSGSVGRIEAMLESVINDPDAEKAEFEKLKALVK